MPLPVCTHFLMRAKGIRKSLIAIFGICIFSLGRGKSGIYSIPSCKCNRSGGYTCSCPRKILCGIFLCHMKEFGLRLKDSRPTRENFHKEIFSDGGRSFAARMTCKTNPKRIRSCGATDRSFRKHFMMFAKGNRKSLIAIFGNWIFLARPFHAERERCRCLFARIF